MNKKPSIWSGLSPKQLVGYTFLSIISGLSGFFFITVINKIIDQIINHKSISHDRYYLISFVVLIIIYFTTRRWLSAEIIKTSQKLFRDSRMSVIDLVLKAPYSKVVENKNKIYATLTQDVNNITQASVMIVEFFTSLILIISCFIYMAYISLALFGISLVVIALGAAVYQFSSSKNNIRFKVTRDLEDDFLKLFNSILQGAKEINIDSRKGKTINDEHLTRIADLALNNNQKAFVGYSDSQIIGQLFFYLLISFILLYTGKITGASLDVSVSFVFVILYILGPIGVVMGWVPIVSRARISMRKLSELSKELEAITEEKPNEIIYDLTNYKTLRYADYSFSYGLDKFSVGPIDLILNRGETIFIYGGNGSGKTTFLYTLLHLFNPEQGELFYNGEKVPLNNVSGLKQIFAVVFSDFYLFDSFYGYSDFDQEKAKDYLKIFEIEEKVTVSGKGFSTIDLSTGQRKRLALISVLLENKPILVLDEWAADQDPMFRKKFYTEIIPMIKKEGKTVLAITHDDKYYFCADQLLKMEEGKLNQVL